MNEQQLENFFGKLRVTIENKELIKLVLSNKKDKSADLKNIMVSIVKLKTGKLKTGKLKTAYRLNFVYRHNTNDITKNYDFIEGLNLIKQALSNNFYNLDISAKTENLSLISSAKGQVRIKTTKAKQNTEASFNHNRIKERLIKTENNIYLRELGIINNNWIVRHEKTDKYRQINRYIELLAPYLKDLDLTENFHIVDMGSGKGYLTFTLYDYLTNNLSKRVNVIGVEFREKLVESCNTIAQKSNFKYLKFIKGTIEKAKLEQVDVLIALHACDTATDEAIFRGITSNASLIVCAPCCHKQIRKQFDVSNELSYVVSHGILKERQAEIITDSLRALIMELFGYKTKVFEFISTEHTPKNLMIVGKKSATTSTTNSKVDKAAILNKIAAIKSVYGIKKHYLEELLDI
ncbi:MAG: SAM-dependent methyltransferase [Pseudomonadota bacterium]